MAAPRFRHSVGIDGLSSAVALRCWSSICCWMSTLLVCAVYCFWAMSMLCLVALAEVEATPLSLSMTSAASKRAALPRGEALQTDLPAVEQPAHGRVGDGLAGHGRPGAPAASLRGPPCTVGLFLTPVGGALEHLARFDDGLAAARAAAERFRVPRLRLHMVLTDGGLRVGRYARGEVAELRFDLRGRGLAVFDLREASFLSAVNATSLSFGATTSIRERPWSVERSCLPLRSTYPVRISFSITSARVAGVPMPPEWDSSSSNAALRSLSSTQRLACSIAASSVAR